MQRVFLSAVGMLGSCFILLSSSSAKAEPPAGAGPLLPEDEESVAKHKRAVDLFDAGISSYERGNFALALSEFKNAYELDKDFHVLYNVGLSARRLGNVGEAEQAFEAYLKEGGAKISAARFDEVIGYLTVLRQTAKEPHAPVSVTTPAKITRIDLSADARSGDHPRSSSLPMWISWGVTGTSLATTIGFVVAAKATRPLQSYSSSDVGDPAEGGIDSQTYVQNMLARDRAQSFDQAAVVAGVATIVSSVVSITLTTAYLVNRSNEEKSATARNVWFDGTGFRGRF